MNALTSNMNLLTSDLTAITPTAFERALGPQDTPTLADCLLRLEAVEGLSPTRRRDLASGLRRVAHALGQPLTDLPADPAQLQPQLARVAPAALGLTVKRWTTILSDAKAALLACGFASGPRRARDEAPSELWAAPWQRLVATGDLRFMAALRPFLLALDRLGAAPGEVGDAHVLAYAKALAQSRLSRAPEATARKVVAAWNRATAELEGWPRQRLSRRGEGQRITLPLATFPASFAEDLARFVRRLEAPDLLDPTALPCALRPATVQHRRVQVVRFASTLVHAGVAPERIRGLADLVDPVLARQGLEWLLAREKGKTTPGIGNMAILLKTLARHHVPGLPAETKKAMEDFARRLVPRQPKGLSPKNRDRLRPLEDEETLRRLVTLPERLFGRAKGQRTHAAALLREAAVALAILQVCPLRRINAAQLHLTHNLRRMGDGRALLVLSAGEVKTHRPLEYELPPEVVRRIDEHVAARSPFLCPPGTPWLFPRRNGGAPMDLSRFSAQLSKRIRAETGLAIHPHLYRHLCARIWLEAYPGHHEDLKRILGHSKLSSTLDVYAGLEARVATRAYGALLAQVVTP